MPAGPRPRAGEKPSGESKWRQVWCERRPTRLPADHSVSSGRQRCPQGCNGVPRVLVVIPDLAGRCLHSRRQTIPEHLLCAEPWKS